MSNKKTTYSARQIFRLSALQRLLILTFSVSLYACSGDSSISDENSSVVIDGTVLTSSVNLPISTDTQVFLDKNQNFQLDANEVVATVKPYIGSFHLEIPALTNDELDSSFLVASNSPNSKQSYYLASPLSAFVKPNTEGGFTTKPAVISPLTSLVSGEMMANQLNVSQATETLSSFTNNIDTLENYTISSNLLATELAKNIIDQWKATSTNKENTNLLESFINNTSTTKATLLQNAHPSGNVNLSASNLIQPTVNINSVTAIPGSSYMVVYKQGAAGNPNDIANSSAAIRSQMEVTGQQVAKTYGGVFKFAYSSAVRGFSLAIPNTKVTEFIDGMQRNPNVDYVEEDIPVFTNAISQTPAIWGLDRIDQTALPLNNTYTYANNGTGVHAYIIDTGLNENHQEFTGRVDPGFTAIPDGRGTGDCKGHGTHVAGIIGGTTYGVAKKIRLTPIRVFDCNGTSSLSGIIAGIDWIIQNGHLPGVINLSLGASVSNTFDQAINNLHNAGYVVVVSAGNYAGDACNQSPARVPLAITVGSSDINDVKSYYSNYGICVDLFAPGSNIKSAWFNSTTDSNTISGTSMSAPHVAGVAALYLQSNPTATPLQINYALLNSATNRLTGSLGPSSPNRLLRVSNTPDFTPVNQPIYVPPITSPLPPTPVPANPPSKPSKPFRIVSIKSIKATTVKVTKTTWKSNVVITLFTSNNGPIDESIITASFTLGGSNLVCKTNLSGTCTITSGTLSNTKTSSTITVTGITGESLAYLKRSNKIVSLTIKRP